MEDNKVNISWYARHMAKSVEQINNIKSNFDFVVEVLDARAPITTHNVELVNIFKDKIFIKIALKKDLSAYDKPFLNDILFASTKNKEDRKKIINHINKALETKRNSYLKKGLVNPTFCGIVIGIPNTGKSSLINFLSNKKLVVSQNKPGVTRKVANLKITDNLFLADTPGIFFKKVDDYQTAIKLSLLNSVDNNIFSFHDIALYCFENIILKSKVLFEIYLDNKETDFETFINNFCIKHGFYLKGNSLDSERAYKTIIDDISLCKYQKIYFD